MKRTAARTIVRRRYGEGPLHLLLMGASFALAGYAGVRLLAGDTFGVIVWFVGAALVHDLVLVPVYASADRLLCRRSGRRPGAVNFVRVPAFLSGLLLLVWFPLITRRAERYEPASGLSPDVFLRNWLLVTAVLFTVSGIALVVGETRPRRRDTNGRPPASH